MEELPPVTRLKGRSEHEAATLGNLPSLGEIRERISEPPSSSSDEDTPFSGHSIFHRAISGASSSSLPSNHHLAEKDVTKIPTNSSTSKWTYKQKQEAPRSRQSTVETLPSIPSVRHDPAAFGSQSLGTLDNFDAVSEQDSESDVSDSESDEGSDDSPRISSATGALLPSTSPSPKFPKREGNDKYPFAPLRRVTTTLIPMKKS